MEIPKVQDLESKVDLKKFKKITLKNEIIAQDNGELIRYVGEINNLSFSANGDYIRGYSKITKYKSNSKKDHIFNILNSKISEIRLGLFPPKIETEKNIKIWSINSGYSKLYINKKISPHLSFCDSCRLSFYKDYKNELKKYALYKEIKLSDKLLNMLFGPIDKKLVEIYKDYYSTTK